LREDTYARFDQTCAAHAGGLLAHDSTADTARDMDLLRQAVGNPALNYLGASYGSYLGATYANMFPTKVRAITLDGDVDPVRWATGADGTARWLGTFLRLGSDQGSAATLNAFLDLCGTAPVTSCAFSAGSPAATHAKFDTLTDRLTSHPVTFDGFTYQGAVAMSRDLADARLLTVRGYGHTALGNHSTCVDTVESDYFVTGALPPRGTVCHQEQLPFPG
jgi:pimeloyl-ACP methyl ester carboxylesterase